LRQVCAWQRLYSSMAPKDLALRCKLLPVKTPIDCKLSVKLNLIAYSQQLRFAFVSQRTLLKNGNDKYLLQSWSSRTVKILSGAVVQRVAIVTRLKAFQLPSLHISMITTSIHSLQDSLLILMRIKSTILVTRANALLTKELFSLKTT